MDSDTKIMTHLFILQKLSQSVDEWTLTAKVESFLSENSIDGFIVQNCKWNNGQTIPKWR